ncbi:ABC transporter permease [Candidatus Pacearchaeota archaeon]|nr:ABC transporter permease [Candidatus Pacearchaeota archaeon]
MAVLNVFKKNLKTVSRNWNYFVVLIVCPIALILIAGTLLSSSSASNLRVGVINEDPEYNFDFSEFKKIKNYHSLSSCINDLVEETTNICFHIQKDNGVRQIDIMIDNSKESIEVYMKKYILEKVSEEQAVFIEETAKDLDAKMTLFSTSIDTAKKELDQVYVELEEQEEMLSLYHTNVTNTIRTVEDIEAQLNYLKYQYDTAAQSSEAILLKQEIESIKSRNEEILDRVAVISSIINNDTDSTYDNQLNYQIDQINNEFVDINNDLETISGLSVQGAANKAEVELDNLINQMMSMKAALYKLESDLVTSISRTRAAKSRVKTFLTQLDEARSEMDEMSDKFGKGRVYVNFKNPFTFSTDPVLYTYPMLIAMIIAFTSIVLSNTFILRQVHRSSHLREIISPAKDISFLVADYVTNIFLASVQIVALFLIGLYWIKVPFPVSSLLVLLSIFLVTSIFIFIGMTLGYLIKTQSLSMLLSIFATLLIIVFSDILAPTFMTGPIIGFFVRLNPLVIIQNILFNTIVLGRQLNFFMASIDKLVVFFIFGFIITYIAKKVSKENVVN